jgi:HAD superfamily hydrolase (TIGR01509 family)
MRGTYRAVIFDMDGLLFDTEQTGRWAWDKALELHGYQLTDEVYREFVGRDMTHRKAILMARFGEQFPFDSVKNQRIELGDAMEIEQGLEPKPGALELLATLGKAEIPIALATGTARARTFRRLDSVNIREHFAAIVTSEDVAYGKPAPDIYLEASRRIATPPGDCIVFEDSCAGVEAAAAAGMCVIMVPDLERPSHEIEEQAHRVLRSLEDAAAVLAELLGDGYPLPGSLK